MFSQRAYTRRQFLGRSMTVVSTAATVPAFVHRSALAFGDPAEVGLAARPGFPDDRILVVVELTGGNDGLNTVIPYGFGEYYDARPRLAVAKKEVLKLDSDIGLHPNLAPIKKLIEAGSAAIVQGVGYPNPNRSHFASMDIWHSARSDGSHGTGWLGRAIDHAVGASGSAGTECICISRELPLAAQGTRLNAVTFENADLFRWAGGDLHPALANAYEQINRTGVPEDGDDSQRGFMLRTALDAQVASEQIRSAVQRGSVTSFPGGQLANQLRMVASMIRAELPTNVYYTALGGFDTHAGQAGRHANNLNQFAAAISAFYKELAAMGQDGRVLTMAFSEFGRRVAQNASNGTDHGTAGPMFLFGPMVRPGLLGRHPSLTDLDRGDLIHHTDFRSVYAGVLEGWFKTDSTKVLGRKFKAAKIIG